jgi:sterol desaturase/sphingolipid hydroxylase (fatty acid hydroxylase superfamily)
VNLNPIVLSIPIFFVLIGVELVVERISNKKLYRLPDAIANLSCGITSQLSGLFLKVFAIGVYQLLYENFNLVTWDKTWVYWVALFLLSDHSYYWAHRMSHQINLFWGGHVVHHQSEDYNLSVALRQSSLQVIWTFAFSLPLAFIGFETWDFALMSAYITLYQFWIHTESINKMGWFEYIFNTPSHHRVHHGRNPKYIDKNHAGTLIIWDKMFGTFQPEEERPTYGITKPINSWNAVWANMSHYTEMAKDLKLITNWKDKIKYVFNKPGWLPSYLGGYRPAPPVDKSTYKKYETPSALLLNLYVLFQYVLCLVGTSLFLFAQKLPDQTERFTLGEKFFIAALISIVVVNCGVLFENRPWVRYAEWIRIALYPIILVAVVYLFNQPSYLYVVALTYFIVSGVWFSRIDKQLKVSYAHIA